MNRSVYLYEEESDDVSEIQQPNLNEKPKKVSKPKPTSKLNLEKARQAKLEQLKLKKIEDARRVLQEAGKSETDSSSEDEVITIKTSKAKRQIKKVEPETHNHTQMQNQPHVQNQTQTQIQPLDELQQLKKEMEELKKRSTFDMIKAQKEKEDAQRVNSAAKRQQDLEATILAMRKNLLSI